MSNRDFHAPKGPVQPDRDGRFRAPRLSPADVGPVFLLIVAATLFNVFVFALRVAMKAL